MLLNVIDITAGDSCVRNNIWLVCETQFFLK